MQRVGICVALGKKADLYLIDEPSAYLDVEQRINTAKGIKKFIMMFAKTAFVVEHDFIMANYLADKFIVYDGQPGIKCKANRPMSIVEGMNKFLSLLGVTFRRDNQNLRPRINKIDSTLDKEQKLSGQYYYVDG
jgi:ATP-binding cassette subfamily E protein 1